MAWINSDERPSERFTTLPASMLVVGKPLLLAGLLLLICPTLGHSQTTPISSDDIVVTGSLAELRTLRHVLLLVRRSRVVDSRGQANSVLSEVYRDDADAHKRYPRTYNSIAQRLNRYMNKYRSMSGARNLTEAEFIVYFNLLEYRRPLGRPYPYGEMYVILNGKSGSKPPRIIWKSRKSPIWVEDAIDEFIRDLKAMRGEG